MAPRAASFAVLAASLAAAALARLTDKVTADDVEAIKLRLEQFDVDPVFDRWRQTYTRRYTDLRELTFRQRIFLRNKALVDAHNANPNNTFTIGLNEFADLSVDEWVSRNGGRMRHNRHFSNSTKGNRVMKAGEITIPERYAAYYQAAADASTKYAEEHGVPTTAMRVLTEKERADELGHMRKLTWTSNAWSWESMGAVTPVMNAGANCRAGYAITAVGAVESGWKKIHGVLARLSVQQVIDCSDAYMNAGCLGGSIEGSYDYIWANDGLVLETQYPYVGYDKNCGVAASNVQPRSAWIYNWYQVESQSDSALAQAVVFNPTGVYLDTSNSYWMLYTGGVITDPLYCNGGVDDAGLVTGWMVHLLGNQQYRYYWTVRMHYGTGWGNSGYAWLQRGTQFLDGYGMCGVYTDPWYPEVIEE